MLFGQLVCYGCQRILTYPLGAVSCRCRLCDRVNAAENLQIRCTTCGQELHAPINTLALLCPCCGTVTDIPEELLPPLPSCVDLGGGEGTEKVIYVSHPTLPPRPRPNGEANMNAASLLGSRRPSTHLRGEGRRRSASFARRRFSRQEREGTAAQGNKEETIVDADADGAREAGGAHSADGKRRDTIGPISPDQAYVSSAVSESSRRAQRVAPSRLAPTVMIATRIL
ncbi:hypothetical protein, conserved [Leishmania donovani]|uniref:LSD1 zinc finger containing protein, putative n=1 Tax=Leishmania donovani TaxID=5661 RepID=A0A3Q8IBZ4_LEIDO|nr:hypothetical protein, conserved [Leishmania donovani]AYU77311.1 LSD1 zinc finger containing protein, putative [Leishmania donovani]TPP46247.1 LSD1 zinc finger family protein [Leishmania donovani]CBZ32724.1 hypothetical protein, conserved [Leishmania donovani]